MYSFVRHSTDLIQKEVGYPHIRTSIGIAKRLQTHTRMAAHML